MWWIHERSQKGKHYFDSEDKCHVVWFFAASTIYCNCNQRFLAIATTGLQKSYCASKSLLIKIIHLKITCFPLTLIQLRYLLPSQLKEKVVRLLLWLPISTSVSSAGYLLWCRCKEKNRCQKGSPAQWLALGSKILEITILVCGSYLTFFISPNPEELF